MTVPVYREVKAHHVNMHCLSAFHSSVASMKRQMVTFATFWTRSCRLLSIVESSSLYRVASVPVMGTETSVSTCLFFEATKRRCRWLPACSTFQDAKLILVSVTKRRLSALTSRSHRPWKIVERRSGLDAVTAGSPALYFEE